MNGCEGTREDLVRDLEIRAQWRTQMAARHPGDERHARSAAALDAAARDVGNLPDDDVRLVHLAEFYRDAADDAIAGYLDEQNALMSRHGFDREDVTTDDLLSALVDAAGKTAGGDTQAS